MQHHASTKYLYSLSIKKLGGKSKKQVERANSCLDSGKAINRNKVQRHEEAACESLDAKTARNQSSLGQTSKEDLHGKVRNE